MNVKEELLKIRKKIENKTMSSESNNSSIDLDIKVDAFIDWYYENMVKDNYTDEGELRQLKDMRNFIEKMAVWYELRYPSYEIDRLLHGSTKDQALNIMLKKNHYIDELTDKEAGTIELDWEKFYNTDAFIRSLPPKERKLFSNPNYKTIVYLGPAAHLHLTEDGYVEMSEGVGILSESSIEDKELEGLHAKDVVALFRERHIVLPKSNELTETIERVDKWIYQREGILNCVMYRIIERGGNRIGPRRAFLFAKEFKRNIDIPMMYGVDFSDPRLRLFINEYIKSGGSKDLICYPGYFFKENKREDLCTITIQELLLTVDHDSMTFYTPEEDELHQRLVDILAKQADLQKKKDEIKRLRLERKLDKSRKIKASKN